jgi:hypothetical protein
MTDVEKDGFRIRGTISQPALNTTWTITAYTQVADASVVDDPDEVATVNISIKVPFNEAPNEAAAQLKMKEIVDNIYDNFIPSPAP